LAFLSDQRFEWTDEHGSAAGVRCVHQPVGSEKALSEGQRNAFISQYEQAGYLRIAYEPDLNVIFQKPDAVQS